MEPHKQTAITFCTQPAVPHALGLHTACLYCNQTECLLALCCRHSIVQLLYEPACAFNIFCSHLLPTAVLKRVVTPGSMEPHKQTAITFCTQPAGSPAAAPPPPTPADGDTRSTKQESDHATQNNPAAEPEEDLSRLAWHAPRSLTSGHIQAPRGVSSIAGQLQAPSLVDDDSSSSKNATSGNGNGKGGSSSSSSSGDGAGGSTKSLTADVLMLAVGNSRQMGRRVKVRG
jgi:uncharacterized membrane protein YgcG